MKVKSPRIYTVTGRDLSNSANIFDDQFRNRECDLIPFPLTGNDIWVGRSIMPSRYIYSISLTAIIVQALDGL